MADLITVMAASINGKVVLWEVHPEHPHGEVYISGDGRSVQVAQTPAVQAHLTRGDLVQVVVASKQVPPDDEPPPPTGAPVTKLAKKAKGGD